MEDAMNLPMDVIIRSHGVTDTEALRRHAERRLAFALRRFEHRVRHVIVRLTDTNGPKGGVDARCAITLQLRSGRQLDVAASTAWPFASITSAARRLNSSVRRQLEKAQLPRRRRDDAGTAG
jgi:ribosome-associated translation inhibitor RaiA